MGSITAGLVYCATNTISGKKYVGQTTYSLEYRRDRHIESASRGSRTVFHKALASYGADAFVWEILYDGLDDQDELDLMEIAAIRKLNTLVPNGYNLMSGGSHGRHSEESKQKMSRSQHGKVRSEAFRRRVSEVHTGRKDTPETTERRRQAQLGKTHSEESRAKIGQASAGRVASEETRQKMSESHRRHHAENPEIRQAAALKSSATQKGRKFSDDHRRRISDALSRYQYLRRVAVYEQLLPTCWI